jgi:hypothetical protein
VVKLEEEGHDPTSLEAALKQVLRGDGKLPIGVFYKTDCPTYSEEELSLQKGPLVKNRLGLTEEEWKEAVDEFL